MTADETVIIDGQTYQKGDEIWDLGSLQCTEANGTQRSYQGFLKDKSKLPKYDDLATGSSAVLIDNMGIESTVFAKYDAQTKTWYNLMGGVVV